MGARAVLTRIALLSLVLTPLAAVSTGPVANAAHLDAESCTPSIVMHKPVQDPGGFVNFPATFTVCEPTRVTIKFRDRDRDPGTVWAGGYGTEPAGSGTTYAGTCHPDGQEHRWVAYATLKIPQGGVLIAKSEKVYLKAKPVSGNCAR